MKKLIFENEHQSSVIESEIFYAIRHSQYKQLALYLRHNYNLNVTSKDGRNGLFYALDINNSHKRCRMIKYCLDHGINALQKDNINGYTVLNETIARQQIDSFQLILAEVSGEIDWHSFDIHGRTILHQAVESNNITIIENLLTIMNRYNVSVDLVDKNGLTPYLLAKKLHLPDMADVLLKKGHASRQKCDSKTHLGAREWENIGTKENNFILRQQFRREINDAMRNGQINKVNQLKQVYYNISSLTLIGKQRPDSYLTMTTRSGVNTKSSLSINEMIDRSSVAHQPQSSIHSGTDKQISHTEHLPPITATPRYRTDSSFNPLSGLFQIAPLS
jgi:hypothetical protein